MLRIERRLGRRIRRLRIRRGLTQAVLAESVGVAVETISRAERGKVVPALENLEKIADALGIALADLFAAGAGAGKARPGGTHVPADLRKLVRRLATLPAAERRRVRRIVELVLARRPSRGRGR